jgi:isoquinoline 1-oxidoreductase alpha subunit
MDIVLNIDNQEYKLDIDPDTKLVWAIRDNLNLKGVRIGCCEGECGACRVLLNGTSIQSCMLDVKEVGDAKITLIGDK